MLFPFFGAFPPSGEEDVWCEARWSDVTMDFITDLAESEGQTINDVPNCVALYLPESEGCFGQTTNDDPNCVALHFPGDPR